jgi:hypothetical protein
MDRAKFLRLLRVIARTLLIIHLFEKAVSHIGNGTDSEQSIGGSDAALVYKASLRRNLGVINVSGK